VHVDPSARGVLPSWLLTPILAVSAWVAVAPYFLTDATALERAAIGPIPASVVCASALVDWRLWIERGKPWHDWVVIVLLLPAIGAAVWITVGATLLELPLTRPELLGTSIGPGIALVGLLATTISFHGRHHPDDAGS
jgi:hypothetical protein